MIYKTQITESINPDAKIEIFQGEPVRRELISLTDLMSDSDTTGLITLNSPDYAALDTRYVNVSGATMVGGLGIALLDNNITGTTSVKLINNTLTRTTGNSTTVNEGFYNNIAYSGTSRNYGLYGIDNYVRNLSSGQVDYLYGQMNYARNDGSATVSNLISGYFSARNNGTGVINKMLGVQAIVTNNSSGVTNNDMYGATVTLNNNKNAFIDSIVGVGTYFYNSGTTNAIIGLTSYFPKIGVVSDFVSGLNIGSAEHPWDTATGASKSYGIYIHDTVSVGAQTNYSIYSATLAPSLFMGKMNFGMTGGTEMLNVSGNTVTTGSMKVGNDSASAGSTKTGALRYREDATNSYCDMCMRSGTGYTWVNIITQPFT